MDSLMEPALAALCAFLTIGLCFAAWRRRKTGNSYLLFWRNPLGSRARAIFGRGFFQGPFAEITRISFFAIVTLIAVAALFD